MTRNNPDNDLYSESLPNKSSKNGNPVFKA